MPVRLKARAAADRTAELHANAWHDPGDGYSDVYSDSYGGYPPVILRAQSISTIILKAVK